MRRLCAWLVDYLIVAVYMGVLFFLTFIVTGGRLTLDGLTTPTSRQLLGALTLTAPVVLYFAISEGSARQGTIGKLATRLRVVDHRLRRIGVGRSLVRSSLKFLPFELAHTFVHRVPKAGDVPLSAWAALAGSLLLATLYLVGLFVGLRRPLYDVLAGTRVIQVAEPAAATGPGPSPRNQDDGSRVPVSR